MGQATGIVGMGQVGSRAGTCGGMLDSSAGTIVGHAALAGYGKGDTS